MTEKDKKTEPEPAKPAKTERVQRWPTPPKYDIHKPKARPHRIFLPKRQGWSVKLLDRFPALFPSAG
jgi:hypothetical protein